MEYKKALAQALRERGYRVVVDAEVEGESGIVHKIPILVVLSEKKYIGFEIAEGEDIESAVIKCFIKIVDVPKIPFYLLVEKKVFREILDNLCSPRIIVFDNLEDLLTKVEKMISRQLATLKPAE